MANWIATTKAIAAKLGTSERRVQQLIKKLGIVPVQVIGKSGVYAEADIRRLEKRNTKRGPVAKKGKK